MNFLTCYEDVFYCMVLRLTTLDVAQMDGKSYLFNGALDVDMNTEYCEGFMV